MMIQKCYLQNKLIAKQIGSVIGRGAVGRRLGQSSKTWQCQLNNDVSQVEGNYLFENEESEIILDQDLDKRDENERKKNKRKSILV